MPAAPVSSGRIVNDDTALRARLVQLARVFAFDLDCERVGVLPDAVVDVISDVLPLKNDPWWNVAFPNEVHQNGFANVVAELARDAPWKGHVTSKGRQRGKKQDEEEADDLALLAITQGKAQRDQQRKRERGGEG